MFRNKQAQVPLPTQQLSATRLFFGIVGGALAFYGWRHKQGIVGKFASSVGLGLIAKSLGTSLFSAPTDVLAALMAQFRTSFPKLLSSPGTEA